MSLPLFSILVANYNNGKYFQDCYDSLVSQSYQNFEVIIVDDCSTDNSVETIEKIIEEDSRFKLWTNEKNKGCGFTKNRCVTLAQGEICGFLDPDDAITSNAIEIMVREHTENEENSVIYSNIINCNEKLSPSFVRKTNQVINGKQDFYNFDGAISAFASFKKSVYEKTTGINKSLMRAIDQDLYLKLYDIAPVKHIDKDLYLYRIHEGGISTNHNAEKAFYWHWIVIQDRCNRLGINPENIFLEIFTRKKYEEKRTQEIAYLKSKITKVKKSKWMKVGAFLGLFRNYKDL